MLLAAKVAMPSLVQTVAEEMWGTTTTLSKSLQTGTGPFRINVKNTFKLGDFRQLIE
jgi:hypothetical protein